MSEALKKTAGIDRLPLFPLPLVLLPNELLPLHIFEDRYRQMIEDIRPPGNQMFGINVVDSADGETVSQPPELGSTGCTAELRNIEKLSDGRSNILTSGLVRYRVKDHIFSETPYFVAEVEFFEDADETGDELSNIAERVYNLFERITRAGYKMSGNRGTYIPPPKTDPENLSFLVMAAIELSNEIKYEMLRTDSTIQRLRQIAEILAPAVIKIEENADVISSAQTNGHSPKDLGSP